MKTSIITTTKSNTENIVRLIESLDKIRKEIYEFIIVNAGTPNIDDVITDEYQFLQILDGRGSTRGKGKNIGIKEATGDIIAFLDDDTKVTKNWIYEMTKSLEQSYIVAGWSPNPNGRSLPRISIEVEGQDITLPSCNIAYRKEVFDIVGFFDEKMITAEDIDFNYRCIQNGFTITYNPKMKVYHYHRSTFRSFAKQAFWNGYGRRQLNNKHYELKTLHQHGIRFRNISRLGFGFLGYVFGGFL